MASLLLAIFVVELAVQLINTIGAATINGLVCSAGLSPTIGSWVLTQALALAFRHLTTDSHL